MYAAYLNYRLLYFVPNIYRAENGMFIFIHRNFPEWRVEGINRTSVEAKVGVIIRDQLAGRLECVDHLFDLLGN